MDPLHSTPLHPPLQHQHHHQPNPAPPPQVRSRITVVCAECKRLKLKCDRRTPCAACIKRDTLARCVYSPAAAEKVDLHSLNNRLIQVESTLAQLTAGLSPATPITPTFNSRSRPNGTTPITADKPTFTASALAIPLKDIASTYLDDLDLHKSLYPSPYFSAPSSILPSPSSTHPGYQSTLPSPYSPCIPVKQEPAHVSLSPTAARTHSPDTDSDDGTPTSLLLPPLTIYHLPSNPSPPSPANSSGSGTPLPSASHHRSISPALLTLLPAPPYRRSLLENIHNLLLLRPSFNFPHFRARVEHLFEAENSLPDGTIRSKAANARAIFFGPPSTPISPKDSKSSASTSSPSSTPSTSPTISFFAAAAAAFALGGLLSASNRKHEGDRGGSNGDPDESLMVIDDDPGFRKRRGSNKSRPKSGNGRPSPAFLYALSTQALAVHEARAQFDLDYLIACLLQVLFLLQGGQVADRKTRTKEANSGVGGPLFPLVGKMVNIARQMGLSKDPDESPAQFSLFEAESRRRVWWDVLYYDSFVSDSMGHPPSIAEGSYSTRIPANVNELSFTPLSTVLPLVGEEEAGWDVTGSKYFDLKCQSTQLIRRIKRRILSHEHSYTLDHAAALEAEIRAWLENLPAPWRLGMDMNSTEEANEDPHMQVLVSQRCELAITAQKVVLRLYMLFLRQSCGSGSTPPMPIPHQASHGTVNAAHVILHACKVLLRSMRRRRGTGAAVVVPALFDFQTFGRTVFDAAVVCAHAAIRQPTAVWAGAALDDVESALEMLSELVIEDDDVGCGGCGGDLPVEEALKIVESLKRKAVAAREAGVGGGSVGWMGTKRKHGEVEGEVSGLQYSFATPSTQKEVTSPSVQQQRQEPFTTRIPITLDPVMERVRARYETPKVLTERVVAPKEKVRSGEKDLGKQKEKEKEKGSKHAKRTHYPSVGIRIRPVKEGSPLQRHRAGSGSTTAATTTATASMANTTTSSSGPGGDGQMGSAPSVALQSPLSCLSRKSIPSEPSTPNLNEVGFNHRPHQQQQQTITHEMTAQDGNTIALSSISQESASDATNMDFSLAFGGEGAQMDMDALERRRFGVHEHGVPSQAQQQQQQQHQQTYASFSTGTSRMYDRTAYEPAHANSYDHHTHAHPHAHPHGKSYAASDQPGDTCPPPSFANGNASMPSSLSSFGPSLSTHHHQQHQHPEPATYNGGETYYMPTGYESEFEGMPPLVGLGMTTASTASGHSVNALQSLASSVPSPATTTAVHYDKTQQQQQAVYEMKQGDHRHSRTMQPPPLLPSPLPPSQLQYQVSHGHGNGHDPTRHLHHQPPQHHHHHHGITLAPPPPPPLPPASAPPSTSVPPQPQSSQQHHQQQQHHHPPPTQGWSQASVAVGDGGGTDGVGGPGGAGDYWNGPYYS